MNMLINAQAQSRPKILVVEDEAIVAHYMKMALEKRGYHVAQLCQKGEEAVKYITENEVDLVLMDIKLAGDMDGLAATDRIAKIRNVPVIFLTAYNQFFSKSMFPNIRTEIFTKPVQEKPLMETIELFLQPPC